MADRLTAKQKAFIEHFDGNATEAARKAGYAGDDATLGQVGYENLRKPEIRRALEERQKLESDARVASRQERQIFWTSTMNDPSMPAKERLRASELLGKSEADFIEKSESKVTVEGELKVNHVDVDDRIKSIKEKKK